MIPLLLPSDATVFDAGDALIDAISCVCTMQDLQYELKLEYPVDGSFYSEIAVGTIIAVKPCMTDENQAFRVYRVGKTIKGVTSFYARHLSYDLSGIVAGPFTAQNAEEFAVKLKQSCVNDCPFTFSTDLDVEEEVKVEVPTSARALLGDGDKSWQSGYGGEYKFDNWDVSLLRAAGENRGVVFEYGVDIVDLTQEENIAEMFTGIVPYYKYGDEAAVVGTVQRADGTFDHEKIMPVDVTEYIASTPSVEKVNEVGRQWLEDNEIGKPEVSLTIQYAQIDQTVRLHDTVGVKFVKLGILVNAQVVKTEYDCLRERFISIDVGDVRPSLNDQLHDASRLKKGLLPVERIKNGSIGGGKIGGGAVKEKNLDDNCVTVNKIANGAVQSVKIAEGAVTGNKILDMAISVAKFDKDLQVTWADVVATNILLAGKVGTAFLRATNVYSTYLFVNGVQFALGTKYIDGQGITALMPVYDIDT